MRTLKVLGAALALALIAALALGLGLLRASLPRLDGEVRAAGLTGAVRIERDELGIPTIEATDRADLAYGTGFVHAQDRFFEMDLARRLAAGELAELFGGPLALEQDRKTRLFGFRRAARAVLAEAGPAERAVLEAYTRGVNAGLASLTGRPWEYWALRSAPHPWLPEDTVLVEYSMWWDLQASGLRREILRQEINARLGGPQCGGHWKCALSFFYPARTSWDAPVSEPADAPPVASAPIPGPEVLDVRAAPPPPRALAAAVPQAAAGSNNWAVAGRLTASGAALIANDMHLGQRVPPVWYRARLRLPSSAGAPALELNGVTLPGAPLLVAGSNGHIAWGFTNSYGTWFSVTHVPCTAVADRELVTPAGAMPLEVTEEKIGVRGGAAALLEVKSAAPGVLLRFDEARQSCWFGAWLAQVPAATNLGLMRLERARSVLEALEIAPEVGIPHQNMVIGDAEGHIAWTICGRIPADTGGMRALQVSAWTTAADQPRIVDPPSGRIWTANARVTGDPRQLGLIGGELAPLGAQYDLGARAGQIRDDLLSLAAPVSPAGMLRIQLDDSAVFLARWRELILRVLDAQAVRGDERRAQFRRLVAAWNARASADSVGYRLVRAYHDRTQQAVWAMILAALRLPAEQGRGPPSQFEEPLWRLITVQPPHMLSGSWASWAQFLRAQVDATLSALGESCPELARCAWGTHAVVRIRHPLSRALPWLASFLDMPSLELPGDHDMPRVQDGAFGASERFAVSPGHESEGYLHLPGGESGHPLSPYYRGGFSAWAQGTPLPFLPGAARHTLTLTPR
jgi:penicillin amidase